VICFDFSPHEINDSARSAKQNVVNFFIIKDFGLYKVSEKGEKLQLLAQFLYGCVVFKEFRGLNEVNVGHDKIAEHSCVLRDSLCLEILFVWLVLGEPDTCVVFV
jgi:hypothetical protein